MGQKERKRKAAFPHAAVVGFPSQNSGPLAAVPPGFLTPGLPSAFSALSLSNLPEIFFPSMTGYPNLGLHTGYTRIGHYSSCHSILLVGEGDFSFSLSLAKAFGHASHMVATSLDTPETLNDKYRFAMENVRELRALGCRVGHGIDVKTMTSNVLLCLCYLKFDRIVFNFPHAGFEYPEEDVRQIKMHRRLLKGFFLNAKEMLLEDGEIHVTHKTSSPFKEWNLQQKAERRGLVLVERAPFNICDYPGYFNKRGYGVVSDTSFPIGRCCTFKFKLKK
ncbi:uncharacterized protein At4g26485-like isoform X1 [Nymphaea colorata]|nr:uncharacterized protein At4g26485-like isoform X1 [Nymphaea colorata]